MEPEKILHKLYRTDFLNFCRSEFYFQFEFFFKSDFQMHEIHLKSFYFAILFIGDTFDLLSL